MRNGQRVVTGFRQVGEQSTHHRRRFEPMLRRDAAAILLRQHAAFGDAEQGIMRLIHCWLGEEAIIGAATMQKWRIKLDFEHDRAIVDPKVAKMQLV